MIKHSLMTVESIEFLWARPITILTVIIQFFLSTLNPPSILDQV